MDPGDLPLVRQRCLVPDQRLEFRVIQRPFDGRQAPRILGMARAGVVLAASGMAVKQSCHGDFCKLNY